MKAKEKMTSNTDLYECSPEFDYILRRYEDFICHSNINGFCETIQAISNVSFAVAGPLERRR